MINLLPANNKKEIRAGRANVLLIRYVFLTLLAVGVLAASFGIVYLLFAREHSIAESKITDNNKVEASYAADKKEAQQFTQNLAIAKQLLDKKINYTDILFKLAASVPAGSVINDISLDPTTVDTPTTITAMSANSDSAIALRNSLLNSPIFSDTHFDSITKKETPVGPYNYDVTFNVTFKKEAIQ